MCLFFHNLIKFYASEFKLGREREAIVGIDRGEGFFLLSPTSEERIGAEAERFRKNRPPQRYYRDPHLACNVLQPQGAALLILQLLGIQLPPNKSCQA